MRHKHSVTDDTTKVVGIAAIAAAIGAVVAMLVTPRNGNQVRDGLKRRANNLTDKLHESATSEPDAELTNPIADAKDKLQVTAEKAATKARAKASDIKTDAKSVQKQVNKEIDDSRK